MDTPKTTSARWTETELAILAADYATVDNSVLVKHLGRTAYAIRKQATNMGLKKSAHYSRLSSTTTEKALPAVQRNNAHKDLEKKDGLASKLRALPYTHPLRVAYMRATPAGSPAGSAPRTMAQLQALIR
jgi:hypothetical protein